MSDMTKTVRSLDVDTYRAFRAKAVELGFSTGQAMTEAMQVWLNWKSRPRMTVRALAEAPASTTVPTTVHAEQT